MYPDWPFHNKSPFKGEYFKYLTESPRVSGASTCRYNPDSPEFIKPGMVFIGENILSVQYDNGIVGDFYEIMLIKRDTNRKKLSEIFNGEDLSDPLRYLNKKQTFDIIQAVRDITS